MQHVVQYLGVVTAGLIFFLLAPVSGQFNQIREGSVTKQSETEQETNQETDSDESLKNIQVNIEALLKEQLKAWNTGDIDGFMKTYWKSPEMTFSGGGTMRRGWDATLKQYKQSYPAGEMGQLKFDGLEITLLCDDAAMVLGNWHLDIDGTKRDGNFSLILRELESGWKIVHDHSSSIDTEQGWLSVEQSEQVGRMWLKKPNGIFLTKSISHYLEITTPQKPKGNSPNAIYVDRLTAKVLVEKPKDLQ